MPGESELLRQQMMKDLMLELDVVNKERDARRAAAREELWNMYHGPRPRTFLQKQAWWEKLQSAKRRAGGIGVPYRSFDELGVTASEAHELGGTRALVAASVQQQPEPELGKLADAVQQQPEAEEKELGSEAAVVELGVAGPKVVGLGGAQAKVVELCVALPEVELGGDGGGVPQIGLGQSGSYPSDPGTPEQRAGLGGGVDAGRPEVELVEEGSSSISICGSGARSFPFDPGKQACYIFQSGQLSCWLIQWTGFSWSVILFLCFSVSWPAYLSRTAVVVVSLYPWYGGSQLCVWLNGNWVGERTFPFDPGKSTIGWYVGLL